MKRFDLRHSETSLREKIKPNKSEYFHELEESIKPTPFLNIFEGVEDLLHDFPKEKSPLQQELSSQGEDMRVPSLRRDQGKGSLNDEALSIDEEKRKRERRRSFSPMRTGGDLFLLGNGDEAIVSARGAFASLQEVPRNITYGGHEQHVSRVKDKETEQRRDHKVDITEDDPLLLGE